MAVHLLLDAVPMGGYVSLAKSIPLMLVLMLWVRLMTWADKDADAAHLPRMGLNGANLGGLVLAFALVFLLPVHFAVAFLLVLVIFGAEVGAYMALRKKTVGLGDLKSQFNTWIHSFGKKKEEVAGAGEVQITGKVGAINSPPPKDSPDRPTYDAVQKALSEGLLKGAEQIDVAPAQDGMAVRYTVDGMPYNGATIDGTSGAAAIMLLKVIAGLDMDERRKPQNGSLSALIGGKKRDLKIQTAGTTAGEYMRVMVDSKNRTALALDALGLTDAQLAAVRASVKEKAGLVLLAAPKGQGLTSLEYGIIRGHDAFLEHIHSIEHAPEDGAEGITQNKIPAGAPAAEEAKMASWVISQVPDVILVDRLEDAGAAQQLAAYAREDGKRVYVGSRAGSAVEAIEQWRKLVGGGDAGDALDALKLVVVGRVVRKLCAACKIPYAPDPATLKKLNMDPAKVTQLFQAREQPLRDPKGNPIPCEFCNDLHFKGRVGVFEVLVVDDDLRAALKNDFAKAGKPAAEFKTAFRRLRGRYLQEEALALVEKGETSVPEVLRVLRGGGGDAGAAAAPARAAPAAAAPRAPARGSPAAPR